MEPKSSYLPALELLEKTGWRQGAMNDGWGRHCIAGALYAIGVLNYEQRIRAKDLLCSIASCRVGTITSWNDAVGRKFEDIRALLLAGASLEMSNGI